MGWFLAIIFFFLWRRQKRRAGDAYAELRMRDIAEGAAVGILANVATVTHLKDVSKQGEAS